LNLDLCGRLGNDSRPWYAETRVAPDSLKRMARKEFFLFVGLLFFGLVIAPIALYLLGERVFGQYGGHGYGDFFGTLSARIRAGDSIAWFFVLSPYLVWQTLRLTAYAFRLAGRH
jgi:hypothetical protein